MDKKPVFHTYSCRFEFSEDYTRFVVLADKQDVVISTSELHHVTPDGHEYPLPDAFVEFKSEASLEQLRDILRDGVDLHVGLQSLRPVPLKENSLERDHTL